MQRFSCVSPVGKNRLFKPLPEAVFGEGLLRIYRTSRYKNLLESMLAVQIPDLYQGIYIHLPPTET